MDRDRSRHCDAAVVTFPGERLTGEGDAFVPDFASLGLRLRVIGNLLLQTSLAAVVPGRRVQGSHSGSPPCQAAGGRSHGRCAGEQSWRLIVSAAYRFRVEKLFNVPAGAFRPAPQVDSLCGWLRTQSCPRRRDERLLGQIVTKAFSQRRATVRNALSDFVSAEELSVLGIDPRLRLEIDFVFDDFVRVANAVATRQGWKVNMPAAEGGVLHPSHFRQRARELPSRTGRPQPRGSFRSEPSDKPDLVAVRVL